MDPMEEFKSSPMEEEMACWYTLPSTLVHTQLLPLYSLTPPGMDLTGNTFWEFTDQINIGRLRRIVEYDKNAHYADVKLARTYS